MTNESFICKMLGGDDKLKMNNDKTPEYHYSNLILRVFRKKTIKSSTKILPGFFGLTPYILLGVI